jgi:hypothetical protein
MALINIPPNAIQALNRAAAALYRPRPEATISDIKRRLHAAYDSQNPNITPQQKKELQSVLNSFAVGVVMNVNKEIRIPRILIEVEAIIRNTNNRPALLGNGGRRSRRGRSRRGRTRRGRTRRGRTRRTRHRR